MAFENLAERGGIRTPSFREPSFYKGNCRYRLYYHELSNFTDEVLRSPAKRWEVQKVVKNSSLQ
jgi:hypothetical protein